MTKTFGAQNIVGSEGESRGFHAQDSDAWFVVSAPGRSHRYAYPGGPKLIMIKNFLFAGPVLLTCAAALFAQNPNYDRCEVGVTDVGSERSRSLGTFDTVIGEEERTIRAFRLPGTKLFVVGAVFYTDESMASEQGSDSMSLELTLSHNARRNVLRSLSFADAEMPLKVSVGRVSMLIKVTGRPHLVVMECCRHIRP